jgi:heavy metal sensor kinase
MIGRPMPLRTRLALGYTAFFALALVLLAIGVFLAVRQALLTEMEQQLHASSELIRQDFDASDAELADYFNDPAFLLRTHPPRIEGLESPALYVQIATRSGAIVATSGSLHEQHLPLSDADRAAALSGRTQFAEVQLGEARVLMLVRPLLADQAIVGVLQVAQPLREVARTLRLLLLSLTATGLFALLAAIRGGAWLTGGALRPVGQIAKTARQIIRAEDLARRVPGVPAHDEIGQLTTTINEMLERLEQLFTTQRRFLADVSHELRTPLTAMRGHLEILRRGAAQDPRALDESLTDMEREVNRLTRLVRDLLLLAQAEAGIHLQREPVALDELVLEVVRELRPIAAGIVLTPIIAEQVEVHGDHDRLKQALLNLVVNGLQHTPPGGTVQVALARADQHACLSVRDTGEGIAAEDLPHVFDRFYRTDLSRSRRSGGAGLGLAIVKWVAEAHGGQVEAHSAPGQGSTFILSLPLADGPGAAPLP